MKSLFFLFSLTAFLSHHHAIFTREERGDLRFMFYNTENLFDPFDDSLSLDEEFLPNGTRAWTWEKFRHKINNLSKVITACGEWEAPELIGLCEIENYFVLHQLVRTTPLLKYNYRIIHHDSPDRRGIDVAFLYRPDCFHVCSHRLFRINELLDRREPVRDILYIKGIPITENETDTLHIFINHWSSRWLGAKQSAYKRCASARLLRKAIDSLQTITPAACILIAGDFNDEMNDRSLNEILGVKSAPRNQLPDSSEIYFYAPDLAERKTSSIKYRGNWFLFDLIMVSGSLLDTSNGEFNSGQMRIFHPDFLLTRDETWMGVKPYRTYVGYKYSGGFSDHLPVYLDLKKRN